MSNPAVGIEVAVEPGIVVGDTTSRVLPSAKQEVGLVPHKDPVSQLPELSSLIRRPASDVVPPAIDMWLKQNGLNEFGDPADVVYTGGPLFDEATGKTITRLSYILSKHPYLESLLPGNGGPLNPFLPLPPQLYPPLPHPVIPGYQQLQQIMQQMMNLLSSLLGALFNKPPHYGIPQPMPGLQPIGGNYPVSPITAMERRIAKVKNELTKLEAKIRKYEMSGKPAPRGWKLKQRMLKNKLAQLQQQLYQMTQPHILPYPLGFKSKDVPELYQRTAEDKLSRDSVKVPVMQDVVPEGNTAATAEMR